MKFITVVLHFHQVLIYFIQPFWTMREADAIACHGVPCTNRTQLAQVVTTSFVLQHRGIIDERIDLTEWTQNKLSCVPVRRKVVTKEVEVFPEPLTRSGTVGGTLHREYCYREAFSNTHQQQRYKQKSLSLKRNASPCAASATFFAFFFYR